MRNPVSRSTVTWHVENAEFEVANVAERMWQYQQMKIFPGTLHRRWRQATELVKSLHAINAHCVCVCVRAARTSEEKHKRAYTSFVWTLFRCLPPPVSKTERGEAVSHEVRLISRRTHRNRWYYPSKHSLRTLKPGKPWWRTANGSQWSLEHASHVHWTSRYQMDERIRGRHPDWGIALCQPQERVSLSPLPPACFAPPSPALPTTRYLSRHAQTPRRFVLGFLTLVLTHFPTPSLPLNPTHLSLINRWRLIIAIPPWVGANGSAYLLNDRESPVECSLHYPSAVSSSLNYPSVEGLASFVKSCSKNNNFYRNMPDSDIRHSRKAV